MEWMARFFLAVIALVAFYGLYYFMGGHILSILAIVVIFFVLLFSIHQQNKKILSILQKNEEKQ